jgi:hypothetical protein
MGLSEGDLMRTGFGRAGGIPSVLRTLSVPVALTLPLPDTGPVEVAAGADGLRQGFRNVSRKENNHV